MLYREHTAVLSYLFDAGFLMRSYPNQGYFLHVTVKRSTRVLTRGGRFDPSIISEPLRPPHPLSQFNMTHSLVVCFYY